MRCASRQACLRIAMRKSISMADAVVPKAVIKSNTLVCAEKCRVGLPMSVALW